MFVKYIASNEKRAINESFPEITKGLEHALVIDLTGDVVANVAAWTEMKTLLTQAGLLPPTRIMNHAAVTPGYLVISVLAIAEAGIPAAMTERGIPAAYYENGEIMARHD